MNMNNYTIQVCGTCGLSYRRADEVVTWTAWLSSLNEIQLILLFAVYLATLIIVGLPTMSFLGELLNKMF